MMLKYCLFKLVNYTSGGTMGLEDWILKTQSLVILAFPTCP